MASQRASDVKITRPNEVAYSYIISNQVLLAYWYMRQSIRDTNISYIDTCTTVIDTLLYWSSSPRHLLIWIRTVGQLRHTDCYVFMLKYYFNQWTRQRIHNTLIAVYWYLRLMGDKTIPDSGEPGLELFYPPFAQVSIHPTMVKWILIITHGLFHRPNSRQATVPDLIVLWQFTNPNENRRPQGSGQVPPTYIAKMW